MVWTIWDTCYRRNRRLWLMKSNMPNKFIKKIDHISISVTELEPAKKFFLELGFALTNEAILEGKWIDEIVNLKGVKAKYAVLKSRDSSTNLELIQYY